MHARIKELVARIKCNRPIILNVTNHVTMDFIANGLLALGASPIMSLADQEIDDLLKISHAVIINIGTLNDEFIALCEKTCVAANRLGKPIILDPVGVGASQYRTMTCLNLLERFNFSMIRGNAGEIMALAGASTYTKGVDSSTDTSDAVKHARQLASHYNTIIVISGKTDAIISTSQIQLVDYGSPLMPMITGSGCLLSSILGAFVAVHHNHYEAASAGVTFYGVCGELAAKKAHGPGSFKSCFLDALSCLPETYHYEKN